MALNPDQYRLDDERHQTIFEQVIKPNLFADVTPSSQPIAIIFGGQPGAGKSAALDVAKRELDHKGGSVEIIGDDLRAYHPRYEELMMRDDKTAAFYTDRDTGRWIEKAIAEAKAQRVNVVIEGTMRDGNVVAATMNGLREAGYAIDARALAVNPRFSEQGILQRYENQKADRGIGRMTTPEAHKAGLEGMLGTLDCIETDKLADRITIYRRGAEVIYSNVLQDGQWINEPRARAVVEAERKRPMTMQERRTYAQGYDKLAEQMARPERQATTDELNGIYRLRSQAHSELALDGPDNERLLEDAQEAQLVQQAMLENASIEQAYQATLADYVEAKYEQVERIESDLENLIDRQEVRLQQTQNNLPGLFSKPGSRQAWQNRQNQQQARLLSLNNRLHMVCEIRDEMGLHSPKIEELATRKMRAENPDLAETWDAARQAARRHEILIRQKSKEQAQERGGRSLSLESPQQD